MPSTDLPRSTIWDIFFNQNSNQIDKKKIVKREISKQSDMDNNDEVTATVEEIVTPKPISTPTAEPMPETTTQNMVTESLKEPEIITTPTSISTTTDSPFVPITPQTGNFYPNSLYDPNNTEIDKIYITTEIPENMDTKTEIPRKKIVQTRKSPIDNFYDYKSHHISERESSGNTIYHPGSVKYQTLLRPGHRTIHLEEDEGDDKGNEYDNNEVISSTIRQMTHTTTPRYKPTKKWETSTKSITEEDSQQMTKKISQLAKYKPIWGTTKLATTPDSTGNLFDLKLYTFP